VINVLSSTVFPSFSIACDNYIFVEYLFDDFVSFYLEFDVDSPRSNVVASLQQDPDDNDSGSIDGSETEEDTEFSHSDEEDIRTTGGAKSEDSVDLRFINIILISNVFFPLFGIEDFSFEGRTTKVNRAKRLIDAPKLFNLYSN
jgi:hypothetical protein